jgi:hypothetical protein
MEKIRLAQKKTTIVPRVLLIIIIVALSIFRVWLIKDREIVAITPTPHDMQLYITNAQSLVQGMWFGSYNERIIARGPIFPILIAGAYLFHIPLGIANTICYVFAALLCVFILYKKFSLTWIAIPLYALLLFNPFVLDHETSFQITRSTFYSALILGVALSILGLLITAEKSYKRALMFSVVFGSVFFLFWYYREEGFFILPLVGIGYGYSVWHAWINKKLSKAYIVVLCVPILLFIFLAQILSFINYAQYGIYTTREYSHPSYAAAFAALQRIHPDSGNPLIPITKHQRMILYQVSPSFAKLQPFLEGEGGENWAENSIVWTGIPKEEKEIAGGAFYFAIRSAVWSVTSPSQSAEQKFFENLTKEINGACAKKYIPCGILPLSGFSLLNHQDRVLFMNNFVNTVQTGVLADKIDISTVAKYSKGPKDQIELFRKMTNGIILTTGQPQPTPSPVTKNSYLFISWWYRSVMPWIFLLTIIHYFYRLIRHGSLQLYDWYQASLVFSSLLFYVIVAIFGTLKAPTNTTAGSFTSGAYGLLLLFVVVEILSFIKKK